MARTKAEFRALREQTGITQAEMARSLGVQVRSVKRWEHPQAPQMPPEDAWDKVERAAARQREIVQFAIDKAEQLAEQMGHDPERVDLAYWLSEEDYLTHSTDARNGVEGSWRMANANARAARAALEAFGFSVQFVDGSPQP